MKNKMRSFEHLFWSFLLVFPMIYCLVLNFRAATVVSLYDVISSNTFGFFMSSSNLFVAALSDLFVGESAVLNLLSANSVLVYYAGYLCTIVIIRLFVSFLLFVPGLCQKWMSSTLGGVEK